MHLGILAQINAREIEAESAGGAAQAAQTLDMPVKEIKPTQLLEDE